MFRYRYTPDGERIDNITDWGLKQFQKAYGKDGRGSGADLPLVGEMSPLVTEPVLRIAEDKTRGGHPPTRRKESARR